ncbi:MAG: hypothetical protein CMJ39_10600 [Phycisphaerae bacterium]|nr:hypothetical protein [Phycisphaerae bacterium]|tara:strand:- start:679 stop:993 length:315 start_codon:yes stop_codon:yes gene_type:complete
MEIGGPYPFRAVAAYQPAGRVAPQPAVRQQGVVAPSAVPSPTNQAPTSAVQSLVAGRVPGGMDFDAASVIPNRPTNAFQLYTRVADRIEAATGVELGRVIDLKG